MPQARVRRCLGPAAVGLALIAGLLSTGPGSAIAAPAQEEFTTPAAPAEKAVPVKPVRFGSTVFEQPGESYPEAFQRVRRTYGQPGVVRMFFPGMPWSWSSIQNSIGDTRALVSFKAPLNEIVAGQHDAFFRNWFANAPTDHVTRWSLWHEPEDDDERGALNPDTYRRAWAHLANLEHQANNERLRSTLILMCWTLERNSGRQWQDYYAGPDSIDLLGFDCYNAGHENAAYRAPADLLSDVVRVSNATGKPWGIAELGSIVVRGDDGSGRAQWLRGIANFARENGGRFVSYFDSDVGTDYRLHDDPSRSAWRSVVTNQW